MSIKCILGSHDWSKDCEKCSVCGKERTEKHDWSKDCEKCSVCGKERTGKHNWKNYICIQCGHIKEHNHDWKNFKCQVCGEIKNLSKELTNALDDRDKKMIRSIIEFCKKENYDINNIRDIEFDQPILVRLLEYGYIELAKLAISAKADVNASSCTGNSILSIATYKGFKDIVELLISKGAKVNPETKNDSPLRYAAKGGLGHSPNGGNKEIVKILLKAGANVNARNEYGHTPLMGAAGSNDVEIMDMLISAGANLNAKDKMGRKAIYYALSNDASAAVEYINARKGSPKKKQKLQGILTLSSTDIKDWDINTLHEKILDEQHQLGYMKDTTCFKKFHVNAGDSLEDEAYIYAKVRMLFSELGGDELMDRSYIKNFTGTDGNFGKYIVIYDKIK